MWMSCSPHQGGIGKAPALPIQLSRQSLEAKREPVAASIHPRASRTAAYPTICLLTIRFLAAWPPGASPASPEPATTLDFQRHSGPRRDLPSTPQSRRPPGGRLPPSRSRAPNAWGGTRTQFRLLASRAWSCGCRSSRYARPRPAGWRRTGSVTAAAPAGAR
jgi:hypothetical protein